jgi:5-formyltetrahydrofolate cyclo-ligase
MNEPERAYRMLALMAASDEPAEVDRAHEQALIQMAKIPKLRSVAAMAYDRTRALAGREQKFGTQAVLCAGVPALWPVDAGTTDSERAKWGMKPLADLRDHASIAPLITKVHLRRLLRGRRAKLTAEQLASFAESIAKRGADSIAVPKHAVVAAYWPLPGEADPRPLARLLAERHGARLALPVVQGDDMVFRQWQDDTLLEPAGFGTFAPGADAPELAPTIVLTPLLGFDRSGARLGQGKGYYDRTFALSVSGTRLNGSGPRLVGIASSCQQLPQVPTESHDLKLDQVLTELS